MKMSRKICKNCFSFIGRSNGKCPVCGYIKGDDEPSALPRGTRLAGRYIVGGSIGRGGFGITYLAYDTRNGETVAVKEYFPTMLARRGSSCHVVPGSEKNAEQFNIGAEKFFDEAELVRRFNGNPNIVSIYECFYENNTAYYVMEYLDGITLENYVKKYGALTPAQTLYIVDKLTMALVVLHSGEVLHRDISPDNVMLCRDGSVKLIDFGAARQFLSGGVQGYTVIMKTGFSPMEQYSQNTDSDIRTDIYSLGTLLYYALTGSVPESPYKRMEDDSEFRENAANSAGGFRSIIEKAAAVVPSERYKSAEEFRSELSRLKINAAVIAVPKDYNSLRTDNFSAQDVPTKRLKPRLFIMPAAAAVCAAIAIPLIVNGLRGSPKQDIIELTLDSEYAGDFNIGGKIPSERLRELDGGVEITLSVEPWKEMATDNICGVIPVNSDDESVLEYLTSPDELWGDENGWINVEKGSQTLSLVMSREGIESLGDGELGFETYNLIITSAVLKSSEERHSINIYDYHKQRNAPYSVFDGVNGKTITVALEESRLLTWPTFESQNIPKSAFYEFDGDVKVTIELENIEGMDYDWREIYVRNGGYCFDVFDDDFLVPALTDIDGRPLITRDSAFGIIPDKILKECVFIIPNNVKPKMSAGVFFQCMNVRVVSARLEAYNGEYNVFVEGDGIYENVTA